MALSNTATPIYYGKISRCGFEGDIPVCKEISMEMNRIDELIRDPNYYYDDLAINGFVEYCEKRINVDGWCGFKTSRFF